MSMTTALLSIAAGVLALAIALSLMPSGMEACRRTQSDDVCVLELGEAP